MKAKCLGVCRAIFQRIVTSFKLRGRTYTKDFCSKVEGIMLGDNPVLSVIIYLQVVYCISISINLK